MRARSSGKEKCMYFYFDGKVPINVFVNVFVVETRKMVYKKSLVKMAHEISHEIPRNFTPGGD